MFKKYFIAGLLVWLPLIITIWIIELVVDTLDRTIVLLPPQLQPQGLFGFSIYGAGAVFALVIILVTGVFAANFLGARIVRVWESLLNRIPVVRSIYSAVKQVSDTVFSDSGQAFRKALLVQYPRAGVWTIAFQTGRPSAELESHLHDNMVSVYVPTGDYILSSQVVFYFDIGTYNNGDPVGIALFGDSPHTSRLIARATYDISTEVDGAVLNGASVNTTGCIKFSSNGNTELWHVHDIAFLSPLKYANYNGGAYTPV
ncbi:MAG: DUF502 domain-containing protein, partial [Betaproteobacteria bacterium]|nr:DUF502 domain-containing protein [Betaproteobacteria bacterium]